MPKIKEYWEKLVPGAAPVKERLLKEIIQKYNARNRHYHNLHHILALLQLSEHYRQHLHNKRVVDLAIFYHDIIYNVLRKDNEARSAVLAVQRLHELGIDEQTAQLVKRFIECTKDHHMPVNMPDLDFFLDFDMSNLAAHWEDYLLYTRAVRKEYRIYPATCTGPAERNSCNTAWRRILFFIPPFFANISKPAPGRIWKENYIPLHHEISDRRQGSSYTLQ